MRMQASRHAPDIEDTATAASAVDGFFAAANAHSPAQATRDCVLHIISAKVGDERECSAGELPPEAMMFMPISDCTASATGRLMMAAAAPRDKTLLSENLRRALSDLAGISPTPVL